MESDYSNGRYCKACGKHHGVLYICDNYPEELKQQIKKQTVIFRENLTDEKWIKEQIDNGVPEEAIYINKIFAGVE